jgi:lipoprotein signal peptidase
VQHGHTLRFPHAVRSAARNDVLRLAALLGTAAFLFDWATKSWALQHVADFHAPLGALTLGVARNDGFAFSAGAGAIPAWSIVAIRLAVLFVLVLLALRFAQASYRFACGCALLVAGGLGNVADLIFRNGAVVDFIGVGPLSFGMHFVFNIADVLIVAGIVLIAPLIRRVSLGAQRRLAAWEERLLGGDMASP